MTWRGAPTNWDGPSNASRSSIRTRDSPGPPPSRRDGFQHLMAEVSLGRAGAVLSLEASRLARCCSDWYRLIEICGLTDTLVIDEDGVYDPTQYNDRLVLGIKGTMSAAELHWIRSRLLGAKLKKAETGQLRYRPPTGLVYDPAGQLVLDPDEQVQQAVHLVFSTFEELGAALGVVQYFAGNHLSFPTRLYGGSRDGQLLWRPWTTAASWPSCIIRRTPAPTSMDEPRHVRSSCPARSPG